MSNDPTNDNAPPPATSYEERPGRAEFFKRVTAVVNPKEHPVGDPSRQAWPNPNPEPQAVQPFPRRRP